MEKTKNIAPHVMACKRCEGRIEPFVPGEDDTELMTM